MSRGHDVYDLADSMSQVIENRLAYEYDFSCVNRPFSVWFDLDSAATVFLAMWYNMPAEPQRLRDSLPTNSAGQLISGSLTDSLSYYVGTYTSIDDALREGLATALMEIYTYFPDFTLLHCKI